MVENGVVIVAAAFLPTPPLLHPKATGSAGNQEASALRSACARALARILGTGPAAVVVLGASSGVAVDGPQVTYRRGDADDTVAAALAGGHGGALLDLDEAVGDRVLASGLSAWRAAAGLLAGPPMDAEMHYPQAPYGVFYAVASWIRP